MRPMVDAIWDVPLSPAEFARRESAARASLDGAEGAEMLAYKEWFLRRYPTPLERLRYCRRKFREAMTQAGRSTR
jgi:hypothetical protein